jgi:ankyrin repeat protein
MAVCLFQLPLCVELMIEYKAEVNFMNSRNETALIYCCANIRKKCDISSIEILLNNSANVNQYDLEYHTPLKYACNHDNVNLVSLLIEKEANINLICYCFEERMTSFSPIYVCLEHKSMNSLELLIERKADLLFRNYKEETVLIVCCKYNYVDILKLVLKHINELPVLIVDSKNAYINSVDKLGFTGLIYACKNSFENIVEILLSSNADTNIINIYELNNALIFCCLKKECFNCLKLLLNHKDESIDGAGIDINYTNILGKTGLIYACEYGYIDIVQLLLSFKADASIADKKGNTALMLSKDSNIQILIEDALSEPYVLK